MTDTLRDRRVLEGPVLPTFLYYVVPSLVGLLAISTASLVDGMFVGRFVGPDALAAVNLLIPYFTLLFGASLMLAVGGTVRAGRYVGEGNSQAAGAIFSKSVVAVFVMSAGVGVVCNVFDEPLYALLGAPEGLIEPMRSYFRVISVAFVVQLVTLVVYYFVRLDGAPVLATAALVTGALTNLALDACFVLGFGWGLPGAALSTAIAQVLQLGVLLTRFASPACELRFSLFQSDWGELGRSALNGGSEFVNEISVGVVMLVLNWLMVARAGVQGVSAFAGVNYAIFASLMVYYGVADALHLLVSQNLGARNVARIRGFMRSAVGTVLALGVLFAAAISSFGEYWLSFFIDPESAAVFELALDYVGLVWPLFLVNGLNVAITVYLAAIHRPVPAGALALARGMVLPAGLMIALALFVPSVPFLVALPLAEWLTFLSGAWVFTRFRPELCLLGDADAQRPEVAVS